MTPLQVADSIEKIVSGRHGDPFSFLGLHEEADVGFVVRAYLPGAARVQVVEADGSAVLVELTRRHDAGFFTGQVGRLGHRFAYRLHATFADGVRVMEDPYRFPPILGDMDVHLIAEGKHLRLDEKMGARRMMIEGVQGVGFAVWAPNASRVSVVGDFNAWDGTRHPMRFRRECGVWEIFLPALPKDALYKYEIATHEGELMALKADPFAFFCEQAPGTAGMVYDLSRYRWDDRAWMERRGAAMRTDAPVAIYEVHLGSWRRSAEREGRYLTYKRVT